MGWTYFETEQSTRETLKELFSPNTILKMKIGKVCYLAVSHPGGVSGFVVLTERKKGSFGYKAVEETVGPYYYDCPHEILGLLSPTADANALKWREKCRQRGEKPKIRMNDTVVFENPIKFHYYGAASTFTKLEPRRNIFYAKELDITVRLTRACFKRDFTVQKGETK